MSAEDSFDYAHTHSRLSGICRISAALKDASPSSSSSLQEDFLRERDAARSRADSSFFRSFRAAAG